MNAANVKTGLYRIAILLACLLATGCLLNLNTSRAGRTRILDLGDGVTMSFVWCPSGEFVMGDQPDGPCTNMGVVIDDGTWLPLPPNGLQEVPTPFILSPPPDQIDQRTHRVRLTNGFWIGKYEVTRRQWKWICGDAGYSDSFQLSSVKHDDDEPIEDLDWKVVIMFFDKLNAMKTKGEIAWIGKRQLLPGRFRLPTEAEWEYACRAGTTGPYNFKGEISLKKANYNENCYPPPPSRPVKVGSYPPNAWGLYDMHGNVREWVQDWYGPYPAEGTATNPVGHVIEGPEPYPSFSSSEGPVKVLRGGSYGDIGLCCTSSMRLLSASNCFRGMRVVFETADAP